MDTSTYRAVKYISAFTIAFMILCHTPSSANSIVTPNDVNEFSKMTTLTLRDFLSESFHLRMRYEFSSRFTNQTDIENLHKMAKTDIRGMILSFYTPFDSENANLALSDKQRAAQ